VNYGRTQPRLAGHPADDKSAPGRQNRVVESVEASLEPALHIAIATCRPNMLAALLLSLGCVAASAASNQVYRCTGANGKVTLSDRRCAEDEPQARAEAAKAAASAASLPASVKPGAKACRESKQKVADQRKQSATSDAERQALRQIEDEHRRQCGGA
jgi:hypothetical protein